jgi:parallel beta-helix repeat protein
MRLWWMLGAVVVSAALLGAPPASADHAIPGQCEVPSHYPTLQSAVDDTTCLIVHAAAGHYTEQVTVWRSVTLAGSGERWTTLHAPASMTDPKAIIRVTGRKVRAKIKHFTLQGPGDAQVGIRVEKDARATVTNVNVVDIRQDPLGSADGFIGVHAGVPGGPQITNVALTNTVVSGSQNVGVLIEGQGTIGKIMYSHVLGSGDRPAGTAVPTGVVIRDGALVTLMRSDVNDNRAAPGGGEGVGVLVQGAAIKTTVSQNNVDRNDVGIRLVGTTSAVVFRNGVDLSTGDGIVLDQANDNTVSRNRVETAGGTGIRVVGAVDNVLYVNELRTNGDGGIALQSSADNFVTGNRADGNVGYGMTDDSTGTRTAGTANIWRSNVCNGSTVGDSSPAGLCR